MSSTFATSENDRHEKLAIAKKKLRQFQNRRRSTSRSHQGGGGNRQGENENLQYSQRQRGEPTDGDDRPLSEGYPAYSSESLAESTASTTAATKAARRASAASSRYLETPEPVRASMMGDILPLQQPTATGLFFHDEQRSPFQRVKRESESSEATVQYSENISRPHMDAFSSLENLKYQPRPPEVNTTFTAPADSNFATMPMNLPSPGGRSGDEEFVLNIDEESKEAPFFEYGNKNNIDARREITTTSDVIPPPIVNAQTVSADTNAERALWEEKVKQQQTMVDQLNSQLLQLNNHYAQLHAAYSNVVVQQQQHSSVGDDGTVRENEELRKQIQLHMQTMSVLVDEKTELQSQLRQAMEIANQKHFENEELQGRLKANRERLAVIEKDLETNTNAHGNLEETLRRQAVELERLRKESAQWQARSSEALQDRSELNAKLKVRSREVDDLMAKLKDVEKQLHLKEIYIQQLTGGAGALQQQQLVAEELENERRVNVELRAELDKAGKVVEQWRWDAEQSKERYEMYLRQLNEAAAMTSARLEASEREKYDLQTSLEQMEKRLESVCESTEQNTVQKSSTEDLESLKLVLTEFENGLQAANRKTVEQERMMVEQESIIQTLNEQLKDRDARMRQLTDQLNEKYQHDDSAKSLLEQLHNEKATVSRAVSQNIELKKQLVELQEKFVQMTESNMETANSLVSAGLKIKTFEEELRQKEMDASAVVQKYEVEIAALKDQANVHTGQQYERSQLEDRLRHYEAVQKHFDSELEKSRRELCHLNVVNADMQQRLVILQDANRDLQNEKQRLSLAHAGDSDQVVPLRHALSAAEETSKLLSEEVETLKMHLKNSATMDDEERCRLRGLENELVEFRHRLQQVSTENAELHRIMEQNAEDENQNTICVELRQALNRSTALSQDNNQLRQRVQELERQLATKSEEANNQNRLRDGSTPDEPDGNNRHGHETPCVHQHHHHQVPQDSNGDDRSSICSEHYEQRREGVNLDAFENTKKAMEQLQNRFLRAMSENADLSDQNQQLEHLITQLQSETETIGEYITIYQHQRRTIRERLKEKEEYVARLSREKEEVQTRLGELQQLVVRLLREKGVMRPYTQSQIVYGKPPSSPPSKAPAKPRTLSQTVVDETEGIEIPAVAIPRSPVEMIPDESNGPNIETFPKSPDGFPIENVVANTDEKSAAVSAEAPGRKLEADEPEDDATAERIMRLLTEMQRPDLINMLPPVERSLHCKYCTGRLLML